MAVWPGLKTTSSDGLGGALHTQQGVRAKGFWKEVQQSLKVEISLKEAQKSWAVKVSNGYIENIACDIRPLDG